MVTIPCIMLLGDIDCGGEFKPWCPWAIKLLNGPGDEDMGPNPIPLPPPGETPREL